jgi:hypothetical protein
MGSAQAPKKVAAAPPSHLFQLTDTDWIDLNDISGIQFQRSDVTTSSDADPCDIALWRTGSETPVLVSFADERSAYSVWKRLVTRLGGSLQSDRWNRPATASRPVVAAALLRPTTTPPPTTRPSQSTSEDQMVDTLPSYTSLKKALADLASCRDEKLITDAEYQRGRDATLAAFSTRIAEGGSGFESGFAQLHAELAELEKLKKDHLLSDDQIATVRERIVTRYGLTPPTNQ